MIFLSIVFLFFCFNFFLYLCKIISKAHSKIMSKEIHLKQGFTIRIEGEADKSLMASTFKVESYAVKPTDFYGMRPKLLVEEGAMVKAGTPLFYDKADERIKTNPGSIAEDTIIAVINCTNRGVGYCNIHIVQVSGVSEGIPLN